MLNRIPDIGHRRRWPKHHAQRREALRRRAERGGSATSAWRINVKAGCTQNETDECSLSSTKIALAILDDGKKIAIGVAEPRDPRDRE